MTLQIDRASGQQCKPKPADDGKQGFGRYLSDHIFTLRFAPDRGWYEPRLEPYHDLNLDPATSVLHYAQTIFEGLKAYRGRDDGVYLFRYRDNLARMNASARRLCMPELDEDQVAEALRELVLLDRDWIPRTPGCALYIRPTMIATDPFLGVRPSATYLFFIITGPVGAYYPEGFNPISIFVSDQYTRAVRGGIGFAKAGGNYAASLKAQREAKEAGYTQVLWLDAIERRYVEEVGTMNIMFRFEDEICTCPLTGTILPGITRDSVLRLLADRGENVQERPVAIDEIIAGARSGRLLEVFGTGTAAIISPVKSICYRDEVVQIGDGATGPLAQALYDQLLGLQYGHLDDPYGWVERLV